MYVDILEILFSLYNVIILFDHVPTNQDGSEALAADALIK